MSAKRCVLERARVPSVFHFPHWRPKVSLMYALQIERGNKVKPKRIYFMAIQLLLSDNDSSLIPAEGKFVDFATICQVYLFCSIYELDAVKYWCK